MIIYYSPMSFNFLSMNPFLNLNHEATVQHISKLMETAALVEIARVVSVPFHFMADPASPLHEPLGILG